MTCQDDSSPSEKKSTQAELNLGPKPEGSPDNTKHQKPEETWDSEGAPSVDDAISSDDNEDNDSAVSGLTGMSSTTSLRPSIYQGIEEYGRTYHAYKEGKYMLPNDEREQDRLELQHALFGLTFRGKLYLAPIGDEVQNVLDIGTGTGSWAIDFAIQHPKASVLGTDLSAIQPRYVPPNCRFEVDDAEDEWVFSTKFDFIHGRALLSCFQNPATVLRKAFDALTPGGYLEMQDGILPIKYVGDPPVESNMFKWGELILEGARKSGRAWDNTLHYAKWMREIGFEDIVEKRFYWPTSPWAKGEYFKQLAIYFREDMLNGLEGVSTKMLIKYMGMTAEEIDDLLAGVRRDFKDRSIHGYMRIMVIYGRKPLATS